MKRLTVFAWLPCEGLSVVIVNTVLKLCQQMFIDHLNVYHLLNESSDCLSFQYLHVTDGVRLIFESTSQ